MRGEAAPRPNGTRLTVSVVGRYLVLVVVGLLFVGPFLWLVATALKSGAENIFRYPPRLLPEHATLANFAAVFSAQPFARYALNSVAVAAIAVSSNLLLSSLAAYPLAKMRFAGRRLILGAVVATIAVPFQVLMIPVYVVAIRLGLQNSLLGLALPHLCSAFGVFLMRQAFLATPTSLIDAARMQGVSHLAIWWHVMLPLSRPTLATLATFSFIAVWGDFIWPLILVDDPAVFTLPIGLNRLAGAFATDWRLVAAGAVLSVAPSLAVFLLAQRFVIGGLQGAVKG